MLAKKTKTRCELNNEKKDLAERIFLNDINECERFPKYIMIEPIFACNARCVMCGIYNDGQTGGTYDPVMPMELFEKILDQIRPYANWIEMVILYGRGEPLLDKLLETRIKKLRDIGIKRVQVSTNVALLTEKRAKDLFASGLNDLRFSIDSIKKDVYESIRVGLNFEQVIENAKTAISIRDNNFPNCPIRIRAVAMTVNESEKQEWMDYWKRYLSGNDTAQFMEYSAHTAREKDISDSRELPCVSPFSTLVIRHDGEMHLCCNDFFGEMVMGNVTNDAMVDIWTNNKFRKIREMHLKHKWSQISLCKNCTVWENDN